jgi:chorismate mutase
MMYINQQTGNQYVFHQPLLLPLLLLRQPIYGRRRRSLSGKQTDRKSPSAMPKASHFLFVEKEESGMAIRGIRGATVSPQNDSETILSVTRELLSAIQEANPILEPNDIASIFFTVTDDLNAVHPALAARQLGWGNVPLMCAREIPVPNSLPFCIRVMIHWNTDLDQNSVHHVYMGQAARLRPDLVNA